MIVKVIETDIEYKVTWVSPQGVYFVENEQGQILKFYPEEVEVVK